MVTQASKRTGHSYWQHNVCVCVWVCVRMCVRVLCVCLCELLTHSQKAVPGSRTVFNEDKGMASKSCNPICAEAHYTHSRTHTHLPLLVGMNECI